MKMMADDEYDLKQMNKKIIETLDSVKQKISIEQNANKINYANILAQALNKVTDGLEDECLQYVLQKLEQWS